MFSMVPGYPGSSIPGTAQYTQYSAFPRPSSPLFYNNAKEADEYSARSYEDFKKGTVDPNFMKSSISKNAQISIFANFKS